MISTRLIRAVFLLIILCSCFVSCTVEKRRYMDGYHIQSLPIHQKSPKNNPAETRLSEKQVAHTFISQDDSCNVVSDSREKDYARAEASITLLDSAIVPHTLNGETEDIPISPKKIFRKATRNSLAGLGLSATGYGTVKLMGFFIEDIAAIWSFAATLFLILAALILVLWITNLIRKKRLLKQAKEGGYNPQLENSFTTKSDSKIYFSALDMTALGFLYALSLILTISIFAFLFAILNYDGAEVPIKLIATLGISAIFIQLVLVLFCIYKISKLASALKNSRVNR